MIRGEEQISGNFCNLVTVIHRSFNLNCGVKMQPLSSSAQNMCRDVKRPVINFNFSSLLRKARLRSSGVICKLPRKWDPHTIMRPIAIYHNFPSSHTPEVRRIQMKLLIFIASSTKYKWLSLMDSAVLMSKNCPEKKNAKWWFSISATRWKELWLRITATQITDLFPRIIPEANGVSRAQLISHFNGSLLHAG